MVITSNEALRVCAWRGCQSIMNAQQYNDEMEGLLREWKAAADTKGTPFISDGVMNPEKWFAQADRPLFLLKEAYGGERDWDLARDHIMRDSQDGKLPKIWQRISLWAYGVLTGKYRLPGTYLPGDQEFQRFGNRFLQGIAAVNLKKYCGQKTSDKDEIMRYAVKDREFLRRQIALCDPTVIVCGNTGDALAQLYDFGKAEQRNEEYFYHFTLNGHEVLVLDYYHPANHYPEIMNYFALMSVFQHAKMDQHLRFCEEIGKQKEQARRDPAQES